MQSLRVAAISIDGGLGTPEDSLSRIETWTARARESGATLLLFPELVVHGHCTPNTWELAERVPGGPAIRRLEAIARQHGATLCVGLSEKEDDIVFNTQVLVGPEGYLGKQRKIHLSRDEALFYKGGRELPVFDIGPCKVGIVICYDNTFPELSRILALRGAEVMLCPHAARLKTWDDTPDSQRSARQFAFKYYSTTFPCRARENAVFCVVADQAGRSGYVTRYPRESPAQPHHPGGAFLFDPEGELIAGSQTEQIQEELVVGDLDVSVLHRVRSDANFPLRVRRPELFGELVRDQIRC